MPASFFLKLFIGISLLLLTGPAFSAFVAQNIQPSPISSPNASPSPSPSASPVRAPSPTPLPDVQNFHQWGSITVFNGLPSDSVRAIAQTPDGVMWFGTENGLARFDGRRIQNFSPGGSESNAVLALVVDPDGKMWIGTRSGAYTYADNQFQLVEGSQKLGITAILVSGDIFLGTDAGLILRVPNETAAAHLAAPLFDDPIEAADGSIVRITGLAPYGDTLIASTAGRSLVDILDGRVTESQIKLRAPFVNVISQGDEGGLLFGTEATRGASGLYFVSMATSTPTRISVPTADVYSVEMNESGVWAGTERDGLFHIPLLLRPPKNYTFENTSGGLRSNTIYTTFTDREGVIWIGTNRGVSRFDRTGASQETVSDIPNSNFVRVLYRTKAGRLYAGSNRGLFMYQGEKWLPQPEYGTRPIYALGEDSRGRLLVSSLAGSLEGRSFANFKGETFEAVFGSGLHRKATGSDAVVHVDGMINALLATDEKLWIGNLDGRLFSFDGRIVKPEPLDVETGAIRKLVRGSYGELWIAAERGVFFRENDKVEKVIDAVDVRDVFVSGLDVWAATTTRGLLHGRRDMRFGWIVSSIAFEQGLPSEKAFSIIRDDEDTLLIGTNRGVVRYGASSVGPKLIPTRILSQRVHDLREAKSTITLDYPQSSLLVEVAGQSSRTFPEEFQYAFVLKNAKGEEIARQLSNDPQYAPSNLSPGDYMIEAIAFNRDLLPSDPLTISFSIARAPFPWTATALGVLLAMSLVALVWAVVERRRIKQRNRELAEARLDLANEAERERRRIARDLHDQTLADLRTLMMTTDKHLAAGAEIRKEIESISTDIRRICEDLSPSVLENVGLVAALEFLVSHTVENHTFHADEDLEESIDLRLNVQLQIYRIAQEVLTNIARHSTATEVEMNVESSEAGEFVLTIRDNGGAFRPDTALPKGRGIMNIRSRANLINGRVAWKESRRGGNIFSLRVRSRNNEG